MEKIKVATMPSKIVTVKVLSYSDLVLRTNNNYEMLENLPSINDVIVKGNKHSKDYGLLDKRNIAKNSDIDKLFSK